MNFFKNIVDTVTSFFGELFRWSVLFFVHRNAKKAQRIETMEKNARIKDKQVDIASKPPTNRGKLLDKMKDDKF